jgi:hypothetical protein
MNRGENRYIDMSKTFSSDFMKNTPQRISRNDDFYNVSLYSDIKEKRPLISGKSPDPRRISAIKVYQTNLD